MELAGIAGGFGLALGAFTTFIWIYQTGAGEIVIDINSIGEANVELVVLCMLLPMIFYAVLMNINRIVREKKNDAVGKKIIVKNQNNLPTLNYHKLKILQGDLKTLSKENLTKLCNSIKRYGYFVPAFIWRSDNDLYILDATQRYHALEQLEKEGYEIPEIPYIEIEAKDRKDAAEKLLQITSRYGEINPETTFFEDFDIDLDFINDIEIPELDIKLEELESKIVEEEVPEPPIEPLSKTSDLWLCGSHRILCGDATNEADILKLMDGKKADLVFTDPPYGMGKDFENDALDNQEDFNELWMGVYNSLFKCPILIWYKPASIDEIIVPARNIGLMLRDYFHLYKPNDIAFPRQSWIRISESMMLFSKNDIEYNEINPYAHDTYIWNHTTKDKSFYHPSVKPIEVVVDVISRIKADIIADFFLGSGTTLIAAEQLNRICYGCEISEAYCDVILDRYAKFTKDDPIREDGVKWSELKSSSEKRTD